MAEDYPAEPFTICPVDGSRCRINVTIGCLFSNTLGPNNIDESNPASRLLRTPTIRIRAAEILGQAAEAGAPHCTRGSKVDDGEDGSGLPTTIFCQMPDVELIDGIADGFGVCVTAHFEEPHADQA